MVRPLWSLGGPALGALLAAGLLTAPIGTLTSAIQGDLGLTGAAVIATVVAPYVVAAAALVAPGYLLGRRWPHATVLSALVLLLLGTLVSGIAPGTVVLAVGRVLAGLGAGTVVGVVLALSGQVANWRTPARLVLGVAFGAALLLGPVVGGAVARAVSWRMGLLVGAPVAVIALAVTGVGGIAMLVLRGSRQSPPVAPATSTPLPGETRLGGPAR